MSDLDLAHSDRVQWFVCDARHEAPCIIDGYTVSERGDPPRCIRHGALLVSDPTLDGLARVRVKVILERRSR